MITTGLESDVLGQAPGVVDTSSPPSARRPNDRKHIMGYGIGGILVLILVILAIIYLAKRV